MISNFFSPKTRSRFFESRCPRCGTKKIRSISGLDSSCWRAILSNRKQEIWMPTTMPWDTGWLPWLANTCSGRGILTGPTWVLPKSAGMLPSYRLTVVHLLCRLAVFASLGARPWPQCWMRITARGGGGVVVRHAPARNPLFFD